MNSKSVLISGSSTGIGKACALYLDRLGYKVYAGVRRESDAKTLLSESSQNLKPVILDVTDSKTIDDALRTIEANAESEFFGLVNNAGIGISGVLEATPISDVRNLMEVNVIGLLAITKAFIPLLKKVKGRIINIGSTSGYLAFPGTSAYSGSKFAVKAITDSLRRELSIFDISVCLVSPGAVESEIWEKSKSYKEKIKSSVSQDLLDEYSVFIKHGEKLVENIKPIPAIEVAKSVYDAINSKKPKIYYNVGKDCKMAAGVSKLPKSLLDKLIITKIKKIGS